MHLKVTLRWQRLKQLWPTFQALAVQSFANLPTMVMESSLVQHRFVVANVQLTALKHTAAMHIVTGQTMVVAVGLDTKFVAVVSRQINIFLLSFVL